MAPSKVFNVSEVAAHNSKDDLFVIIHGKGGYRPFKLKMVHYSDISSIRHHELCTRPSGWRGCVD